MAAYFSADTNTNKKMMERGEYSPSSGIRSEKSKSVTTPELCIMKTTKKKKNKNKRRFSDEQIKSLESIFETESKLEPRKKLQLSIELGLQPRQVAIWFQNRRARWKSKQLERDYGTLRANYDALASRFESLKTEKQSLLVQLQKLSELREKHQVGTRFNLAGNSRDGGSDNGDARCEAEAETSLQLKEAGRGIVSCPDGENSKLSGCFGQEEPELNLVQPPEAPLTSPENWCSFDSKDLFDQSCTGSQWWDFWT